MRQPRLYGELAAWWSLLSPPEDYVEEARLYGALIEDMSERDVREVLELGSGGGNNAAHLKDRFEMTLVDLSEEMLDISRRLNPECEHVRGDMRTFRLGRTFDAVFVHDAVMYMTTEEDLRASMVTAWEHLCPGGVAVFVPDETTETFEPRTLTGGHDGEGRSLRYMEWTHPLEPGASTSLTSFVYLLREGDGPVRCEYDEHVFGLFPRQRWLDLLREVGFSPGAIMHSYGSSEGTADRELFVGSRRG